MIAYETVDSHLQKIVDVNQIQITGSALHGALRTIIVLCLPGCLGGKRHSQFPPQAQEYVICHCPQSLVHHLSPCVNTSKLYLFQEVWNMDFSIFGQDLIVVV